jgi:transposase
MMGRQAGDQSQLFYLFNLEERVPASHLLRRINPVVTRVLADLREKLEPFYSEIGRPSIDPELMIRMLIVGYCYGIRFERRLCEEVELHLAYRWFCRLDLDDKVPDHSTFSVNRHGRFRDSDIFRYVFEAVVRACMDAGLSRARASPSMPASWRRTPAGITARLLTRSTGRCRNVRPARSPSF